jgi:hypothetical protein
MQWLGNDESVWRKAACRAYRVAAYLLSIAGGCIYRTLMFKLNRETGSLMSIRGFAQQRIAYRMVGANAFAL